MVLYINLINPSDSVPYPNQCLSGYIKNTDTQNMGSFMFVENKGATIQRNLSPRQWFKFQNLYVQKITNTGSTVLEVVTTDNPSSNVEESISQLVTASLQISENEIVQGLFLSPAVDKYVSITAPQNTRRTVYGMLLKLVNNASNTSTTYTSSGTFTVPATGVSSITVEMWGGGGGGGNGGQGGYAYGGGGGGSGGHIIFTLPVTGGQSFPIVTGSGGSAAGGGTVTTFGTQGTGYFAQAGGGGGGADNSPSAGGNGGTGGTNYFDPNFSGTVNRNESFPGSSGSSSGGGNGGEYNVNGGLGGSTGNGSGAKYGGGGGGGGTSLNTTGGNGGGGIAYVSYVNTASSSGNQSMKVRLFQSPYSFLNDPQYQFPGYVLYDSVLNDFKNATAQIEVLGSSTAIYTNFFLFTDAPTNLQTSTGTTNQAGVYYNIIQFTPAVLMPGDSIILDLNPASYQAYGYIVFSYVDETVSSG